MKKALLLTLLFLITEFCCLAQGTELEKIQTSLENIKDSTRYVDALNRIAMLLYEKNIDSTFFYTAKARAVANRLDYEKGKADATNNLGVFFDIKGNLQLALRYYNDANIGYTKVKDSSNQVQAMMNIAMVYKELGKDERAITHYNNALQFGKKLSKDSILSLTIYNYLLQFPTQFTKAEKQAMVKEATRIAQKYKDSRTMLAIEQLVADDLIAGGQRDKGIALLAKTIDSALAKELYYVSMDLIMDIGDRLVEKNANAAINYYNKGLDIANRNGYLIYSKLLAKKLFDYYNDRKDYANASRYGQQVMDAIAQQELHANNSGVDYLDYAIKEQEVQALVSKSKYQTLLVVLSIIACFLAILIMATVRKNLKKSRRLNKMISEQNYMMRETLVALEHSQSDNAKMIKIAAHDLRSPIGGIYAVSSLMMEDEGRTEEDLELLQAIKQSADNSLSLVKELLEFQVNSRDFKREPLDVAEMLNYCVNLLQDKSILKNQQLQLQTFSLNLLGSREKLWRVVSNLIANAIKFSPEGSTVKITSLKKANNVLISVEDSGIGISEEMQHKIFELYTDAKREGTAGEETYGLGLFITKQIVEAHQGKIWCESKPGKGSTFFVELPLQAPSDSQLLS